MPRGSAPGGGGQKPPDEDEDDEFALAMRGVRRLGGVERVPVAPGSGRGRRSGEPTSVTKAARVEPAAALVVEDSGLEWTARAGGVDRRTIRSLRGGSMPVDGRLDLHGLTRIQALRALRRFVDAARAASSRHLLIVHGRGLHSGVDGPSLPQAVRDELTMGHLAPAVLACGTASSAFGGAGATFVFLRR